MKALALTIMTLSLLAAKVSLAFSDTDTYCKDDRPSSFYTTFPYEGGKIVAVSYSGNLIVSFCDSDLEHINRLDIGHLSLNDDREITLDYRTRTLTVKTSNGTNGGADVLHIYKLNKHATLGVTAHKIVGLVWKRHIPKFIIGNVNKDYITLAVSRWENRISNTDRTEETIVYKIPTNHPLPVFDTRAFIYHDKALFKYYDFARVRSPISLDPKWNCVGADNKHIIQLSLGKMEFFDFNFNYISSRPLPPPEDLESTQYPFDSCRFEAGKGEAIYYNHDFQTWRFSY